MSSADGGRAEDGFYTNAVPTGEISSLAHLSTPLAPPTGAAMPPPIMWQPPLLNQQYIHHQPHTQPSPSQQQQQYNELYYNMHGQAYAAPPVQPETYSVLPVGHGNFLKVYHRTEGGPAASGANDAILYQQQFQQQQQFHLSAAAQQTQPIFNSYELFSSSTLMPTPENINVSSASQNLAAQEVPMQQQPTIHWTTPACNNAELHSPPVSNTTTNMIINKLVNNWSPNLTGATYSQFSAPLGQVSSVVPTPIQNGCSQQETQFSAQMQAVQPELSAAVNSNAHIQDAPILTFKNMNSVVAQTAPLQPGYLPQTAQQSSSRSTAPTLESSQQQQQLQLSAEASLLPTEMRAFKESPAVSGSVCSMNVCSPLQPTEGSKKRIVAEVKPMRMTYSDVLSKLNNEQSNQTSQPTPIVKSTADRKSKVNNSNAAPPVFNERKSDYKRPESIICTQRPPNFDDSTGSSTQNKATKKSPTHDTKESVQQSIGNTTKPPNNKQRGCVFNNATNNKNSQKVPQKAATNDVYPTVSASQKKRANKRVEVDFVSNKSSSSARCNNKSASTNAPDKDFNGFYNVTAKNTESVMKSAQNISSNAFRRSAKSLAYSTTSSSSSAQNTRNNQRSANGSSSSAYTFSTKRGRSNNVTAANINSNNRNYELAKKLFNTWLEYTMKIMNWLFYLVYDIIVLGFSMVYDRLIHYYVCGYAFAQQLRKEFRQNSNRPSIWLKNYLRRFDARFKKNSRWALWRLFYKKKQPEASTDFYKNGRLPQTGDEAMYSLLNCKGKDAYSILGVPSNSSQEQIRKHYKKIAVLVHPDKNKQAGAEEAFKVLQRAFELIGEPENRESYDRSLDEALHAEKAWTELHDLLSQLQTKITEAANTIRCSTCGLRHPRKLTDRPHYAARECASCKIRHSAREGDIWAETTLLGLRWKYLALMEGKVYNITEWANCQKGALSHLEPNSHMVQYRIVRGAQNQQQHQQPQQQKPQAGSFHHSHPQVGGNYAQRGDIPPSEATLHEFLDNLYSGQNPNGQSNPTAFAGSTRKRTRRN